MINFSIIIPVYNEEKNVLKLINEIKSNLKDKYIYEIIFINDCSTDQTLSLLNSQKIVKNIKIINLKKNMGQSYCIYKGVQLSESEIIITLDGDCQNNPKDILKLYEVYMSDVEILLVGGIRKKRRDNIIKVLSSKIANKIRSYILQDGCIDTGCGLKVFEKKTFLSFPFFNGIHRFLPALYKGYGKKTFFVNVDHRNRLYGNSKYGTISRLIKGIIDIIRVINIIKNK
tara:strand:- start:38852 stop:39538 length:687 start_codon:yes stop_codon:yes gene_type:complete